MTVQLGPLVVDAEDPAAVTRFWESVLGDAACRRHLDFRLQRQAKVVKNRVHVDLYVRDVAALLALGAHVLAEYLPLGRVTLADVGAEIGPGPDGTMRWLHGALGQPELIWKFVRVHDERVVPNRWQWSVTEGRDELVAAGAAAVEDDVLLDPHGNEVSAPGRMSSAG